MAGLADELDVFLHAVELARKCSEAIETVIQTVRLEIIGPAIDSAVTAGADRAEITAAVYRILAERYRLHAQLLDDEASTLEQ